MRTVRRVSMCPGDISALRAGRRTISGSITPQPEVRDDGCLLGEWLSKPLGGLLLPKVGDLALECPIGKRWDGLICAEDESLVLEIVDVRVEQISGQWSWVVEVRRAAIEQWGSQPCAGR